MRDENAARSFLPTDEKCQRMLVSVGTFHPLANSKQ
jgi:hypothetical protein